MTFYVIFSYCETCENKSWFHKIRGWVTLRDRSIYTEEEMYDTKVPVGGQWLTIDDMSVNLRHQENYIESISYDCGCEGHMERAGNVRQWVITTFCEEHDPTTYKPGDERYIEVD